MIILKFIYSLSLHFVEFIKLLLESAESLLTSIGIIIAGAWAIYLFTRQREDYPHIEFTADILIHSKLNDYWIIELQAIITNKGKVQHKIFNLGFELSSINVENRIEFNPEWNYQLIFPRMLREGTFMKEHIHYYFIEPGVTSKYSHVTAVPVDQDTVIFHTSFNYADGIHAHVAEATKKLALKA